MRGNLFAQALVSMPARQNFRHQPLANNNADPRHNNYKVELLSTCCSKLVRSCHVWSTVIVQSTQFLDVIEWVICGSKVGQICAEHAPVPRTVPKLTAQQVATSLIYH
jgi:hypothetical protein